MLEHHQTIPKKKKEREKLRDKGQFWTPDWIAKAMISYVIKDTDLIFDPGTGTGAFFRALKMLDKNKKIKFYGIDIDSKVLQERIYEDPLCNVELRDFLKNPPNRKFKSIVANPPYIRHHRIDKETKSFLKQLSKRITGISIDGRAGYHIYFLLQALQLLEKNGRLAFIMPSDTCEGTFAKKLWVWITKNYCLECVVTFDENATPFPTLDINPIIFLIKNITQKKEIFWVRVNKMNIDDLTYFLKSDFKDTKFENLYITTREISEALRTGLSRHQHFNNNFKYYLSDFATVMRGIATGANNFFFLTRKQAEELKIPNEFLKLAIGRTRDVKGDIITMEDIKELEKRSRPTLLLSIDRPKDKIPKNILDYLHEGEKLGLPTRALIKQRKPWYKMEKREIPPLLFAYLGRRNSRFIKNEAGVVPLTGFLCVYPKQSEKEYIDNLWKILNHPSTLQNLRLVGKSYGSGAIKVEPRNLEKLPIPENLVRKYKLEAAR